MDKTNSKMRIASYGTKVWKNSKGLYHNECGPAIEYADGDKRWCINGKRHRLDGPAREWDNGHKSWYINHIRLSKKEFNSWILRVQRCM